jgi:hypothetical protein
LTHYPRPAIRLGNPGLVIYFIVVKTIEVSVEANGVLKLPAGVSLPARTGLAVLALEPEDLGGIQIAGLAEASGAFDFLKEEPDLYSDSDILPGRVNPRFRK